jgi:hypothetical protein
MDFLQGTPDYETIHLKGKGKIRKLKTAQDATP